MEALPSITLRGVRVHNLKNIAVDIPTQRLTVVTGVSGAGKSSLVFDTLYAEAQRRYLQTFSTWTRQYLERFDRPDADEIGDLPPAIALRGHRVAASSRITVATLADIADDLRVLFARAGTITCPACQEPVRSYGTAEVVAFVQAMPVGSRCTIAFATFLRGDTDQAGWLAALLEEGYVRIQAGGRVHRLSEGTVPPLGPGERVWVLLDRVEVGKTSAERIAESIELAFWRGEGRVGVLTDAEEHLFAAQPTCTRCGRVFVSPEPRLFDSNDPLGACTTCGSAGMTNGAKCPACDGRRFNPDALAVTLGGRTIADCGSLPLAVLQGWARALSESHGAERLRPLRQRLDALVSLDLGHLALFLPAVQLSNGEARRIALAAALTSNLVNVLYLIDEPTLGADAASVDHVVGGLKQLRDRGNTVVVIDQDRTVIAAADYVLDLGPAAGDEGGSVVYAGPPAGLADAPESPTSDYWTGRSGLDAPVRHRKPGGSLHWSGADPPVDLPLGVLCVVTGAGSARLVEHTLFPLLVGKPASGVRWSAAHKIHETVLLDQQTPARSSRSNPATYLKVFDEIRNLFAEMTDARIRNFGAGYFSFNQPGGRCETCEGQGTLTIDMQFLADVISTCPECRGKRFRGDVLEIKVRSLSIAEVLELTIREAFRFFRAQPKIEKKLKWLIDVGLDYLRLGQPLETLSGSECQRLKLAAHLATGRKPGVLFLLTEPSAGLHPADIASLLDCFDRMLGAGHSLIIADSDPDLLRGADRVVSLGTASAG